MPTRPTCGAGIITAETSIQKKMRNGQIIVGVVAVALLLLGVNAAIANQGGDSPFQLLQDAIADLQGQIEGIELTPGPEGPTGPEGNPGTVLTTDSFYVKITDSISYGTGNVNTVIMGCDEGDVAIGGGLYDESLPRIDWKTVRSAPVQNGYAYTPTNWHLTVASEHNGSFKGVVECLDLTP